MKRIKYILLLTFTFALLPLSAQEFKELWITGSAVPEGIQKLDPTVTKGFKFAGALNAGEVKIQTTRKVSKKTLYLVPNIEDANIVTNYTGYKLTSDDTAAGWQVTFQEGAYRFYIYPRQQGLHGELFKPWGELFIGGGATKNGWDRLHLLPLTQDISNPYLWTWIGELKAGKDKEPLAFKFAGQLAWGIKELHPFTANEDPLSTKTFRVGGEDIKWEVKKQGRYKIVINLFTETFKATYLGK